MKTKFNLPKNAVQFLSVTALIASGMFMLASCSKEENSIPSSSAASDQYAMRTDLPVITMQQSDCEKGNCAKFDFQAYADGWVIYNGYANVGKKGRVEFQLDRALIAELAKFANDNGFFKLKTLYPTTSTGNSEVITFARFKQLKKTVTDYGEGTPDNLKMIKQAFLDKLEITPLIEITSGGEVPVISLVHKSAGCADCPEYSVSLFADGKMIYEGITNVRTQGTVEVAFAPEVVFEIYEIARSNGFEGLEDNYRESPDQPYTQTAIIFDDGVMKTVTDWNTDLPDNLLFIKTTIEEKLNIRDLI